MTKEPPQKDSPLVKSDEAFRLLVEGVADYSIFMLDPDGIITTWNSGAERLSGYLAHEAIGKHFSIFYPADTVQRQHADYEMQVARTSGRYCEEGVRLRKDGSRYWANVSINALHDPEGVLKGYSKVIQDITERKEAERKLQESQERLRLLVESVKDYAIFMLDPDGIIASWNSGAQRIKGYSEQEIVGKHFSTFYPEEQRRIGHPERELELAKQFGRYEEEGVRVRKDGTQFQANVVITALYDSQHCLRGFAKVTRDITERKLAEENLRKINETLERKVHQRTAELQVAKEAAEEASRAKTAFLANMSHEIRTPLNAVIGFSEILMQSDQEEEDYYEAREAIRRNGKLLVNIIDDILDFAKIEAGQVQINKEKIHLADFLSQIAATCNLQAQEKGLDFTICSEGHIPLFIESDPVRLKQIMFNVIGNAIKFTSRGRVTMTVKEQLSKLEGAALLFVVEDTGPGIDPDAATKLFAPFSQVDASLTRKFGGTGLGLALSKRLAAALGGDVELTGSTPGHGSVFTVSIPTGVKRSVLFDGSRRDASGMQLGSSSSSEAVDEKLDGVRVLLVEDVHDNRTLIKRYLQRVGAVVECADNGLEGLEKTIAGDFDLVLMDLSMPVMDGYEATIELRKRGFNKPIVALTAHALAEDRNRCSNCGFDDHLAKPISQKTLVQSVFRLVK